VRRGESGVQSLFDLDGMGSIPAIPDARNVPLLLCHERFNEATSLPSVRRDGDSDVQIHSHVGLITLILLHLK